MRWSLQDLTVFTANATSSLNCADSVCAIQAVIMKAKEMLISVITCVPQHIE